MTRPDPFTIPEWKALHREASLISQILGSGATALSRASYGSGFGEYYTAFFGLSVGIERLAKLILVANYALENNGALPGQSVVRKYGHKLRELIAQVGMIAEKRSITVPHIGPDHPICTAVINCLDAFSDASKGRYANFEAIGNPSFDPANEPVNKWWTEVVEPILDNHYRGKKGEAVVKRRAAQFGAMADCYMFVLFTDETGNVMSDATTASERTGQTKWAQNYGRFYTLSVVRWLSYIFDEMTHMAGYQPGLESLFGHYEFFRTYMVNNHFLLKRKVWPLT
ncbi:hypothetical protein [Komagataeibacter intermedius]|uniref:Uncharacterized protein n=2 Tax=Komagataeibacter intermedius TaxID=66229 RepID=A0A0N1FCI3_9PROT|nr:hypothetical protein [Komagataeibacter intermedius]KPH88739.1 hypothetical protein GLUCOINTEAF2_0203706 [Komagataeibacter intermedius AF2]